MRQNNKDAALCCVLHSYIGLFGIRFHMPLDRFKRLVAEIVLDLAGVVHSGFAADAEHDKHIGEQLMALKHVRGNLQTFFGQEDVVVLVDGDKAVFAHLAQDDGYRRTGIGEIRADVDGMHLVLLLERI